MEFLSAYPAKLLEYSLAVAYLIAFIPFWRYVQGGKPAPRAVKVPAARPEPRAEPQRAEGAAGWFTIPEPYLLHPGHSWARMAEDGTVTIGLDDFAHKLVGPVDWMALPRAGAELVQGMPALSLGLGAKSVDLLAPVDGTVVEVNPAAQEKQDDPYGAGWLLRVKAPRAATNAKQLMTGAPARRWLEAAGEELAARLSPQLGQVLQDGGVPVSGIAHELEPERWDELARKFFLS